MYTNYSFYKIYRKYKFYKTEVLKMAKEIAPTPVLEGKDAYNFLLEMTGPASEEKKRMLEEIEKKNKPILL